jgi:hypothetical protein
MKLTLLVAFLLTLATAVAVPPTEGAMMLIGDIGQSFHPIRATVPHPVVRETTGPMSSSSQVEIFAWSGGTAFVDPWGVRNSPWVRQGTGVLRATGPLPTAPIRHNPLVKSEVVDNGLTTPVPEPSSLVLLGFGLTGLGVASRLRRKKA